MKVLVAGAAGFLGSHLSERLLKLGHSVIGIDNLFTGSYDNVELLRQYGEFTFIEHDVRDVLSLKVDSIANLACPASPVHYQIDPVNTVTTNVIGTKNLLDLATKQGAQILQASTSEVYGDPTINPQVESYWGNVNPIGIRACYDEGKRVAETMMFDYHRQYGTKIKVARIFNTYGPRMQFNDGRVVTNFISQALKGENITIYGDGTQTRSFCYQEDLINGLVKLLESPDEITGPINLGNPTENTMLELAEKIIKLANSRSQVIFEELPKDDPKQRKPDISKATALLGWLPTYSLNEGLTLTISDMLARLS